MSAATPLNLPVLIVSAATRTVALKTTEKEQLDWRENAKPRKKPTSWHCSGDSSKRKSLQAGRDK